MATAGRTLAQLTNTATIPQDSLIWVELPNGGGPRNVTFGDFEKALTTTGGLDTAAGDARYRRLNQRITFADFANTFQQRIITAESKITTLETDMTGADTAPVGGVRA